MPKPTVIEARFRIVTPMFLGGSDNSQPVDAIRPPSVKGALRFWWRALNWPRIRGENPGDESALKALHREEARLLGAAAKKDASGRQTGGQGCFLLRVTHDALKTVAKGRTLFNPKSLGGALYLGYGLMTHNGELTRPCIKDGQLFSVRLVFQPTATEDDIQSMVTTLKCLGLLGGLGSRTRRGYGSIALESLARNDEPLEWNRENYQQALAGIMPDSMSTNLPPFTAFSSQSRISQLLSDETANKTLARLGKALVQYRGWGRNNTVLGKASEKRFKDDHDWCRVNGWRDNHNNFHPKRVVFGLPHNYGKNGRDKVKGASSERRASPLFFHVHPIRSHYAGIALFLPATFLPTDQNIDAGGNQVPQQIDWHIITDFLKGVTTTNENRFPDQQVLWP